MGASLEHPEVSTAPPPLKILAALIFLAESVTWAKPTFKRVCMCVCVLLLLLFFFEERYFLF